MPNNQELMDRLFESPELPSLPTVALQIIDMVQEDEVNVEEIAKAISNDPALSTKMLKTVNSSFYGMSKTIGSLQQAVVVLGLNSVKTLALGFSLVSNLTKAGGDDFDHVAFWRRSLYAASTAKHLCELMRLVQAEEVFMASLLQDVGVLALAQVLGKEYTPIMQHAADDHSKLAPKERDKLGIDHIEVGAKLADSWGLPPLLVESIRLHEDPDEAPENLRQLIQVVAAGGLAADLIGDPLDESLVADYFAVIKMWFDFDQPIADKLLRDVIKSAKEAQRLFELPTGELADADAILKRANEVLEQLALEDEQGEPGEPESTPPQASVPQAQAEPSKTVEPKPVADQKVEQAPPVVEPKPVEDDPSRDKLTGLLDRARFEKQLESSFADAGAEKPLSLVFIDIDQFKAINESHGNEAGDYVLRSLAELIDSSSKDRCELFRFGDDEFMLLCSQMDRPTTAVQAENIRTAIESKRFSLGSDPALGSASLTASLGVVTYEGAMFKRADQLIKAAIKGAEAAKQGGGNIVRIFVPAVIKKDAA